MRINSKKRYKTKYLKLRKDNDILIVCNHNLEIYFFDDIASEIYLMFNRKPYTTREIADKLFKEYEDIEYDILVADVEDTVDKLFEIDLLEETLKWREEMI